MLRLIEEAQGDFDIIPKEKFKKHFTESLKIRYTIPMIPPSNNKFIGKTNFREYQSVKKEWVGYVNMFCNPKPPKPIEKSIVTITYFFKDKGKRDPDNYSGKMILDGLVRNLILKDDSFSNISLVLKADLDRENPHTEIEILEIGGQT